MKTLSVSDFRSNLAASFNKAANGENILIRRKNEIYALIRVEQDDLTISPALQAKIERARKEFRDGKTLTFSGASDASKWMESL